MKEIKKYKAVELKNVQFLKHINLLMKQNTAVGRTVFLLRTLF